MVSVATFLVRTPREMAEAFLCKCGLALPASFEWSGKVRDVAARVKKHIETAEQRQQARVLQDFERVALMSDEGGQAALLSVFKDNAALDRLTNSYSRSCWVYLHDPVAFQRAEEARYTDEHRRGRKWTGVVTRTDLQINSEAIGRFKGAVLKELGSDNVHVDIFDRQRLSFDGSSFPIVQVSVFRDGLAEDFPEFVDGKLDWRSRRPVYEAAVTYEANSGVVEVVAENREIRKHLVEIFVRDLLGVGEHEPLPFREFDLAPLLRPCKFSTDRRDGIESVRVAMLRLQPFDNPGERITLECSSKEAGAIWDMANSHFGKTNPLMVGFVVTQAKLVIRFHPEGDARRGKTLPLTVTMPHGCDLKDRTQREILIGEKYLKQWKLLSDA